MLGDAETAVRLGLANRIVADDSLVAEAIALAERLAQQPARALQDSKRALNLHLQRAINGIIDYAVAAESECFLTVDHADRVAAFKRRG